VLSYVAVFGDLPSLIKLKFYSLFLQALCTKVEKNLYLLAFFRLIIIKEGILIAVLG
jgi:hypothetical protein